MLPCSQKAKYFFLTNRYLATDLQYVIMNKIKIEAINSIMYRLMNV